MSQDSPALQDIKIGLWQVRRLLDAVDISDALFEVAIAKLQDLWARYRIEHAKEAD